jgi:rSAM/selenodomain-associated transferase 2
MAPEISIIIPAYNEATVIENTLVQIIGLKEKYKLEIIVADGGSKDSSVLLAKKYARVIAAEKGKSKQLNAGAAVARGEILFFVHADMLVPDEALRVILETVKERGFDGGGFDNIYDKLNKRIKLVSAAIFLSLFSSRRKGQEEIQPILYGDNGIFIKASVFRKVEGFKEIPIMEDYDLSKRLNRHYKMLKLYEPKLIVSSRRLLKSGIFKTVFTWLLVQKLYKAGVSPNFLFRLYRDVR